MWLRQNYFTIYLLSTVITLDFLVYGIICDFDVYFDTRCEFRADPVQLVIIHSNVSSEQ